MTKVYPNASAGTGTALTGGSEPERQQQLVKSESVVLTVWKKSLLFNCDGFTVFDAKGNLVFRVDNYAAGSKGEISLMDASGTSLLTIRRKRMTLGDNWLVFEGEKTVNPRFLARKHVTLLNTRSLAQVSSGGSASAGSSSSAGSSPRTKNVMYEIEGSYAQRCCAVYDDKRRRVAEIKRKEAVRGVAFGADVFRLVVQPEVDSAVAMALVILLDQMYGSSRRFST
ncbi:hypothetical protein RJ639_046621 [Escallonia herrerae]|uniref:Protein LURP-one-related 8 n=1 Tax=Escallonia herrerae TaxID=1293975 RepID=A0AA88W6Z2_9ASTE|nr:hypothetical protein RJ639_046621 [Escallonia herrerae]